jgi:bifunctional NMN adenylyltransferase/nudix hydrolase
MQGSAVQLEYEHLVFIGRFQPLHNGHLAVLQHALTLARRIVIVLGSASKPRSPRNPFTESERHEMILAALGEVDPGLRERLCFVSVRDCYDDQRWRDAVELAVSHAIGDVQSRVGVIGYIKDASSKYLRGFRRWPLVEAGKSHALSATEVRAAFLSTGAGSESQLFLARSVPPAVLAFLEAFRAQPAYRELAEAYAWTQQDRAQWPKTPYPVLTNTVDAVVRCNGHVLMIKRRNFPGRGLWALPGGHVDEYELLKDAALRELREETGLDAIAGGLESCLRGVHTFDYPWRSQRGRVITQAYYFELSLRDLPAVRGSDDAVEARWIAEAELPAMEARIHDDHLHIVEHFLGVAPRSLDTISEMTGSKA